jgi:PrcB C-terminal
MFSTIVLASLTALPAFADPEPTVKKELFAKEDWYKSEKGKEQDFVGVLKYTPRAKGVVGFGRFNPYKLEFTTEKGFREVYVGGKEDILKDYAGKKVKIAGKPVDMEVEGRNHREIWPARIETLPDDKPKANPKESPADSAKSGDRVLVPVSPATATFINPAPKEGEVKVPSIIAKSPARLAVRGGEATQAVYRSAEELAKSMPNTDAAKASESAAQSLKVKEIDWKTQMIIVVSAGTKRSGGYSVEVTGLEFIKDKELVVKWKLNSPGPNQPVTLALTHPAQTILVDRFEGKVVFDPAPPKSDIKLPDIKRPDFKRPVDRIPPGTLPVVPEKEDPNKPIKICGDEE